MPLKHPHRLVLMALGVVATSLALASARLSIGSERTLLVEESSRLFGGDGGYSGRECGPVSGCSGIGWLSCYIHGPNDCNYAVALQVNEDANKTGCNDPNATYEVYCEQGPNADCASEHYCYWVPIMNTCEMVRSVKAWHQVPSSCGTRFYVPPSDPDSPERG